MQYNRIQKNKTAQIMIEQNDILHNSIFDYCCYLCGQLKEGEMSVAWKFSAYKADAEKAYSEISQLSEITPQNVLNLAKNEDSEIHNDFEWDDSIAGEKYRLHQARQMIQSLVFKTEEPDRTPTRVLQITTERNVYKPTEFFVKHEDEYQALLNRALSELESFQNRYKSLAELEDVLDSIEKALKSA